MVKSIRARALFFPQQHIERMQGEAKLEISNFIHRTEKLEEKWIEETTEKIGDWKDLSRSIYLRWAITINAMCLAAERYKEFPTDKALRTNTMRSRNGQA